jgi:hypothetical protein
MLTVGIAVFPGFQTPGLAEAAVSEQVDLCTDDPS